MTHLTPILNGPAAPSTPGGGSTPPVSNTLQDVSDVVYNYNDAFSANAVSTSWGKLLWDKLSYLTREVTDPLEGAYRIVIDTFRQATKEALDAIRGSVEASAGNIDTLKYALGADEPTTIRQQVDTLVAGGSTASWWSTVPFDVTDPKWVSVASGSGEDVLVLPAECHAIVFNFTGTEALPVVNTYSGVPFRFKLGWWAEMSGTAVGERRFIDSESALLHHYGHLMIKVIIYINRGGTFDYTAYKYTP